MPDEPANQIPDLFVIDSGALPSTVLESDSESTKESKELFGDDKRDEEQKQAFHVALIWFVRLIAVTFMLVFLVRVVHLILPDHLCWLTDPQLQGIDKTFFSGVMGAVVARYSKQAIKA